MSLKPCRACNKEISTSTKRCPNCGKKNPHVSKAIKVFFTGSMLLFALAVLIVIFATSSENGTKQSEDTTKDTTKPLTMKDVSAMTDDQAAAVKRLQPKGNDGERITDLSPLARLTNLEWLHLGGEGQITDLSPLAGLTNLKTLIIAYNMVPDKNGVLEFRNPDLLPLLQLPRLEWLGVAGNEMSDSDWTIIQTLMQRGVEVRD